VFFALVIMVIQFQQDTGNMRSQGLLVSSYQHSHEHWKGDGEVLLSSTPRTNYEGYVSFASDTPGMPGSAVDSRDDHCNPFCALPPAETSSVVFSIDACYCIDVLLLPFLHMILEGVSERFNMAHK